MPRPPSRGRFTDRYGPRRNPVTGRQEQHHGLDINAAAGRVLVAPADATLTAYGIVPGWEAHGRVARLMDRDGWEHWLSHTDTLTAGRRVGDQLDEGEHVAIMGDTGQATGLHVHWETRDPAGNRLDPEAWLARPAGDGNTDFTPPTEEQDIPAMYSIVPVVGVGVHVVSLTTGRRQHIPTAYHVELLKRARNNWDNDTMLPAELDIVRAYLDAINPAPGHPPGDITTQLEDLDKRVADELARRLSA